MSALFAQDSFGLMAAKFARNKPYSNQFLAKNKAKTPAFI
jgi:hypothetical protein